jgi:hypothetical protein
MEELKSIADWLTTGITYSQNQESERKSELQTDYRNRNTNMNQKTVHTSGRVKV